MSTNLATFELFDTQQLVNNLEAHTKAALQMTYCIKYHLKRSIFLLFFFLKKES